MSSRQTTKNKKFHFFSLSFLLSEDDKVKYRNKEGFTLIELIVAIAVSGVFFAMIGVIVFNLLNSYNEIERNADRQDEIKKAWVLIEETVEEVNDLGMKLIITDSQASLQIGDTEYLKNDSLFMKNDIFLNLIFIKDLEFKIINPNTVVFIFTDDIENRINRIYNLYGGVELEGES